MRRTQLNLSVFPELSTRRIILPTKAIIDYDPLPNPPQLEGSIRVMLSEANKTYFDKTQEIAFAYDERTRLLNVVRLLTLEVCSALRAVKGIPAAPRKAPLEWIDILAVRAAKRDETLGRQNRVPFTEMKLTLLFDPNVQKRLQLTDEQVADAEARLQQVAEEGAALSAEQQAWNPAFVTRPSVASAPGVMTQNANQLKSRMLELQQEAMKDILSPAQYDALFKMLRTEESVQRQARTQNSRAIVKIGQKLWLESGGRDNGAGRTTGPDMEAQEQRLKSDAAPPRRRLFDREYEGFDPEFVTPSTTDEEISAMIKFFAPGRQSPSGGRFARSVPIKGQRPRMVTVFARGRYNTKELVHHTFTPQERAEALAAFRQWYGEELKKKDARNQHRAAVERQWDELKGQYENPLTSPTPEAPEGQEGGEATNLREEMRRFFTDPDRMAKYTKVIMVNGLLTKVNVYPHGTNTLELVNKAFTPQEIQSAQEDFKRYYNSQ
jgi:hypothetical protein